jgi:hypothetical protein
METMMNSFLACAAALLVTTSAPAIAQTAPQPTSPAKELPHDRGYDVQTPKHDAVDAQEKPVTEHLNHSEQAVDTAIAAQNTKQYAIDQTEYRAAVAARREKIAIDEATYQRNASAYADAMAAWRAQVTACKAGHQKACDMPSPTPAEFY